MLAAAMRADFGEVRKLKEENERLRRALEERKLIDKAKGILMKKEGLLEEGAYRRIQKLSMDRRRKMAEIAEAIILAEEVAK